MKQIKKGKGPDSLLEHSRKEFADYKNYDDKQTLREHLCAEQRGICCYCMSPIKPQEAFMKNEHFKCQDIFPEFQLKYWNILGACKGNEGEEGSDEHCDTFKKNKFLSFFPAATIYNIESLIEYKNDGTIYSTNTSFDRELKTVLNLNVKKLVRNRKAVLDGFKDSLKAYRGQLSRKLIERWVANWSGENSVGNLNPYCMVIVYWLKKKL